MGINVVSSSTAIISESKKKNTKDMFSSLFVKKEKYKLFEGLSMIKKRSLIPKSNSMVLITLVQKVKKSQNIYFGIRVG